MSRHNRSVKRHTSLTLSEVGRQLPCVALPHVHHPRLCLRCSAVRFRALNPRPLTPAAVRDEAIADAIRTAHGNVWPAMLQFGISYRTALRIRRGWRRGGIVALPIPYDSRGWLPDGRRPGWSTGVGVA